MYKVMYRLKETSRDVFAFWGEKQKDGSVIPYEYETENQACAAGMEIHKIVGTNDIRIVYDEDYYLKLCYGEQVKPVPDTYTLNISCREGIEATPVSFEGVAFGGNATTNITLSPEISSFHLRIDGHECLEGLPSWIKYISTGQDTGIINFETIVESHEIEIISDKEN